MGERIFGSCLCGEISYNFDRDDVVSAHHCHCRDCRKVTGSGKATIIKVPTEKIEFAGKPKIFVVTGTDGSRVARGFCEHCGSQLMSYVQQRPNLRFIKAGTLDDGSWIKITSSLWTQSAQSWSPVDPACTSFSGNRKR